MAAVVVVDRAAGRLEWVDRLKVAMVAAVIVAHCAMTYGADGSWFYVEDRPGGVVAGVVDVPLAVGALFLMGAFFFLAGCFTPAALVRRGPAGFVRGRAVRLGVPALAYALLVVPGLEWTVAAVTGPPRAAASVWRRQLQRWDTGPLWFAAALLLFSVGYAGWRALRPKRAAARPRVTGAPLTARGLIATGVAIAAVSFGLRLRFAINTFQIGSAHVWQWGQCVGMFALGVLVGRGGLADPGRRVVRAAVGVLLAGLVAVVVLLVIHRRDLDPLGGGFSWTALAVAGVEGCVAVAATTFLLAVARVRPGGRRWRRLGRAAFPAYVLQAPVIVGLALLLRPMPAPAIVKFALLAVAALTVTFGLPLALRRHAAPRFALPIRRHDSAPAAATARTAGSAPRENS